MLKIRRPLGRLIFNMGIAIPGKTVFLIETAPRISSLNNMYNITFPRLRELWLQVNDIFHFDPELIQLPTLQTFSLRNNTITELPDLSGCVWGVESESVTYAEFYAANNPFHCNGSMKWLGNSLCRQGRYTFFKRFMLAILSEDLFCHSPREVQGRTVVQIDELDVGEIENCGEFRNMSCSALYHYSWYPRSCIYAVQHV